MRRKFTIGLSLIIILFSTTTLYAQTDLKDSLKSWYLDVFSEKVAESETEFDEEIVLLEKQVSTELDQSIHEITKKIDDFQKTSTKMSEQEITAYLNQYKYQLDRSKQQLIMDLDFELFLEREAAKIEEDVEEMAINILRDLLDEQK